MPYSYGDPSLTTKSAVRKAGERIANGSGSPEDHATVRNWRNSHAFVLTTFQNTLRRYIRNDHGVNIVFAQRLKRLNTIIDKLSTGRAKDLSTMHDLAGCRLIFDNINELNAFRSRFHESRARHVRLSPEKYDYINAPKSTGYRGVHDVFSYLVNDSSAGSVYNGLRIEIQYRTKAQHAWATAVEISDILDGHRTKFDSGVNPNRERLFVLASEYIARSREGLTGYLPNLTEKEICQELQELEHDLHAIANLRAARKSNAEIPRQRNIVLHFSTGALKVFGFSSPKIALKRRDEIEQQYPSDDVVYVSAESPGAISNSFRNYFTDAADFVDMLTPALSK